VGAPEESRCGLWPLVRRRLPARGGQPLAPAAYRFERLSRYGAVAPLTGQSCFLALLVLKTPGFQLFRAHLAATAPACFHLLLLDNGAFPKPRSLRLPPKVAPRFFPPYAPELKPLARLWRALKDGLAPYQPTGLEALAALLGTQLKHYTASAPRSLTGFSSLLTAINHLHVQFS
jgi:transposase